MLLGFLIGCAVAIVGVFAGGGIVLLVLGMDRRAQRDSDSLPGQLSMSLEEKNRMKEEDAKSKEYERESHPTPAFRR